MARLMRVLVVPGQNGEWMNERSSPAALSRATPVRYSPLFSESAKLHKRVPDGRRSGTFAPPRHYSINPVFAPSVVQGLPGAPVAPGKIGVAKLNAATRADLIRRARFRPRRFG